MSSARRTNTAYCVLRIATRDPEYLSSSTFWAAKKYYSQYNVVW